jgi:hypothetical protein
MAIWDDAWDTITGGVDDTFSGETVKDPNRDNFYLGGSKDTGGALRGRYAGQGDVYRGNATAAQQRGAPLANYGQANADYGNQAGSREAQMANTNRLLDFANGPAGPSGAQAQLQMGSDKAMAANLALAGSGTGMGDSSEAMRRAQFANATQQSETANQAAMLRAQEEQARREMQLGALGQAQDAFGAIRGADLGARDQSIGQAQFGVDAELQNRGLNDAFTQGMVDASMGYDQMYYDTYQDELAAAQQYEAMRQGAATSNQSSDAQRDGQILGTVSSLGGMAAMMSDRRAKKRVARLDELNDEYAALSD